MAITVRSLNQITTFLLLFFISGPAFSWSLFSNTSYEECAAEAAKTAKTNNALTILLQNCSNEFPGRLQPDGSYMMYVPALESNVKVSGPKPSVDDLKKIDILKADKLKATNDIQKMFQLDEQKRTEALKTGLTIKNWHVDSKCYNDVCYLEKIWLEISNKTKYPVYFVGIGYNIFPNTRNLDCSDHLSEKLIISVEIKPYSTYSLDRVISDKIRITDNDSKFVGCIEITSFL